MTREEWAVLVKAMKAVYTSPSFLPDQYAFDTWYGLLKDLDYKLLSFGLKKYMQTEWKEPTIAALRQCAQSLAPQSDELNETEAWNLVSRAIWNSIYHAEEEFSKLPEIVQKAVSSPGQLEEWAKSGNIDGTWWSVVQSNFQRTYRAEVQREQERRKLSPDLLKIIDTARSLIHFAYLPHRITRFTLDFPLAFFLKIPFLTQSLGSHPLLCSSIKI